MTLTLAQHWQAAKAATAATRPDHDTKAASLLNRGYRAEIQTDGMTQVVKGHRTNHILHLLLSVFTGGLWLLVWFCVAVFGGEKRKVIARNA